PIPIDCSMGDFERYIHDYIRQAEQQQDTSS
ncbi:unnamed protein product, partial [Rotaria sordida]